MEGNRDQSNPSFHSDDHDDRLNQVKIDHHSPEVEATKDTSIGLSDNNSTKQSLKESRCEDKRQSDSAPQKETFTVFSRCEDKRQSDSAPQKETFTVFVSEEDKEDYSLRSYFKQLTFYRSLEAKIGNHFKNVKSGRFFRKVFFSLLLLLYILYLIAALLHSEMEEDYWCEGDGFLAVISCICFLLLSYFQILKPRLGKKIVLRSKSLLENNPAIGKIRAFFQRRYGKISIYCSVILTLVVFVAVDSRGNPQRLISLLGIFVLISLSFVFSMAPRKVIWRHVLWGLGLQYVMGLIILRWSVGRAVLYCMGQKVQIFLSFTDKGSEFVYGELVSEWKIIAFKALSVIYFSGFCISILYYYGIMQWVVIKLGWLLQVTVGTTACESVSAAANIFLGMAVAPLVVKPMLPIMTMSELHTVMTGGFATIAGAIMSTYISFGVDPAHLLSASFMSAPAGLGVSKLFYPELEVSRTTAKDIMVKKGEKRTEANVLHAACEGVVAAVSLVVNIIANLIAIIAFLAFINSVLNWTCRRINVDDGTCSLSNIFGYALMPLAWVMGVPWRDCYLVGQLLGTKTIFNEFIAYAQMANLIKKKEIMKRSEIIATYALCGFSNIGSIGIQIGGLGAIAPQRRRDFAKLGLRAMIAGSVACFLTACVAGSLIDVLEDVNDISSNLTSVDYL